MTFVQRNISVQITLASPESGGQKTFAETGTNTVTLSGLRASAKISKAGGRFMSKMDMKIYGLTLSLMNQLSTLGIRVNLVPRNSILVSAGDAQSGMSTVFAGNITNAWAYFQSAPNVPFNITAHTGIAAAVQNVLPTSYNGSTDVATAMAGIATQMGLAFENNGVTGKIDSPYLYGSPRDQALKIVETAGISWAIDNGTLIILPKNGSRGGQIPLVSPSTGMIGYPSYDNMGIFLRTLFNPSIGLWQKIQVESSLPPANAIWAVYNLDYDLESQVLNGQWFQNVYCYNPSFPRPVA